MNKRYLFGLLLLLCGLTAQAQVARQFWFAPPWMNSHHTGEAEFHLILSAYDDDAHVVISQPADGNRVLCDTMVFAHSYCDIIIASKSDHKTYAETWIEVPYNVVSQRGMLISSDNLIGAYYQITHANGEAYTLKGDNALGTEFVVMSQNRYANQADYAGYKSHNNSIQIVATEDATTVTIYPSQPVIHDDNTSSTTPITVTLNKGETYAVKASGTAGSAHLIGTVVKASKPIAVTTSDDSVAAGSGQDAVGEQLVSTDMAGTDFTVIPQAASTLESIYILALHPATSVTLYNADGDETIALDSLQNISRIISGVTYIHADADIQVFQLTNRNGESGGTVLPQMRCTGSDHVTYKRIPNSNYTILNILTQTANIGSLYMNGNEIPASGFQPVPGTDNGWSYIALNVTSKPADMPVELESVRGVFQLGVVDYASQPQGTLTYGFFSNYANGSEIEVLIEDELLDSVFVLCEGGEATLVASAPDGVNDFKWYRDDLLIHSGDTLSLQGVGAAIAGRYRVEGESRDCTVENKEFLFVVQPAQTTIPVTEVIIEKGESYTWPANGQTYTVSTRDTVWMPVYYEGAPVAGCDTALALNLIVRSCVNMEIQYPTDVCGDETALRIPYTLYSGEGYSITIAFDEKARRAGFTDGVLAADGSNLIIPIPSNIYADSYSAVITCTPAMPDCETFKWEIHFEVRYPASIFAQRWNDVLAVKNERFNRGEGNQGYRFTAFQWFKDGQPIPGATGSYYYTGPDAQLDFNALYSVQLTRDDGVVIRSCEYRPVWTDASDQVVITH